MPNGTLFCDHRHLSGSTRISFWTNRYLTSLHARLFGLGRFLMQVIHSRCAGLDGHKKTVVVCVRLFAADGTITRHLRTFGTTTAALLDLIAWLLSLQVTHVAMESTGEFWKPLYNLLEGSFSILVVNAAHIKYVPGRKTDV